MPSTCHVAWPYRPLISAPAARTISRTRGSGSAAPSKWIYGVDVTDEIIANCGLESVFTPKELKVANELGV
ncbi:MAG: hypothetical protein NVS3B5_14150 [Sphingomicrobium sp.]